MNVVGSYLNQTASYSNYMFVINHIPNSGSSNNDYNNDEALQNIENYPNVVASEKLHVGADGDMILMIILKNVKKEM